MDETIVNIHDAKTRLSQLVARAERGECVTIARNGEPVAQLGPITSHKGSAVPPDDPLLNLEQFAAEGAGGALSNADIDRLVYGKS
jgi:prevent-host-death family protein